MLWAARRATVLIDGEPVGTVWGDQRVSVQVANGEHRIEARIGRATSRPLTLDVSEAEVILAIRIVLPADPRQQHPPTDGLELVLVPDYDDRTSVTLREALRNRPPVGYRRLRGWERPLYAIAFIVALASQLLRHTLGPGLSLAIGGPAGIVMVVLVIRLFIYRADR